MDIKNKTVLILGGWGLVGSAIARNLMAEGPKKIILTSLKKEEAEDICKDLTKEFKTKKGFFVPWYGNVFVRNEFKDKNRELILKDAAERKKLMHDISDELNDDILHNSALYKMMQQHKPDVVIDCINTATAIAYQNIFKSFTDIQKFMDGAESDYEKLKEAVEKFMCVSYIPQLIRHIQILYYSMTEFKTKFYLKIGTSGTGGMGLNIPYTHSEEKPSRMLLSKSSVAGAHTLLLFLMARTPNGPAVKELKPTASIAWKKIAYGEIKKGGRPIALIDTKMEDAEPLEKKFHRVSDKKYKTNGNLKTVFIDTGENGIFSAAEFETISTVGQMQFVTPEEIAENAILEIKGHNTGHDVINAIDSASMEPSYRAGFMQQYATNQIKALEKKHKTNSVAFEMLGPPRLTKLLFEANLIRLIYKNFNQYIKEDYKKAAKRIYEYLKKDSKVRNEIISIGIPIILPDGKKLLRGPDIKSPSVLKGDIFDVNPKTIDKWCDAGWFDLREKNWKLWNERFKAIMKQSKAMTDESFSSRYIFNDDYWDNFKEINIGKVVGWIFINEEQGVRNKG